MSNLGSERDKKCAETLSHLQQQMQRLTSTCDVLGWDLDEILKSSELVTCPLSRGHRMPETKIQSHLERCKLRHRGLSHEEIDSLPPSSFPFYEHASAVQSLIMTPELQSQILSQVLGTATSKSVPPSAERALIELSTEERRALYDGVIQALSVQEEAPGRSEFTLLHQLRALEEQLEMTEESTSAEDLMLSAQEERDRHRRRRSYRGVHTDRRSHHEVLRDVIDRQMALLRDVWRAREETRRRRKRSESDHESSPKKAKKASKKKKKKKEKAKKGKKRKRKSSSHSSSSDTQRR